MTIQGNYTGERVVDKIPITTLLLGANEDESAVLEFLRENKDYAYSIKFICKEVLQDKMLYNNCCSFLKKMYEKGIIHKYHFINISYYFNKY